MAHDELIERICKAVGTERFEAILEHVSPRLSVKVMLQLVQHIDKVVGYDPHRAVKLAEASARVADVIGDPKAMMWAKWIYGWSLYSVDRMEEALVVYDDVIVYLTSVEDWKRLAGVRNNQLAIFRKLGRYDDVFATAELIRETLTLAGPDAQCDYIRLYLVLAQSYFNIGNFQKSSEHAQSGLQLAEQYKDDLAVISFKMAIANLHYEFNNYDLAQETLDEGLELAIATKQRVSEARIYFHIGLLNQAKGLYQTALASYEISLNQFQALERVSDAIHVNYKRAAVYLQLNLLQEAIEFSASASDLSADYVHYWSVAESYLDKGQALVRAGEPKQAEQVLTEARNILEGLGAVHVHAQANLAHARLRFNQNDLATSYSLGNNVLTHAQSSQHPMLHAQAELLLARCDLAKQDVASAKSRLSKVKQLAEQYNLRDVAIQGYYLAGLIAQSSQPQTAYNEFERAVSLIANQNANLLLDEFRIGYLSDKMPIFAAWIAAAHERISANELPEWYMLHVLEQTQTAPLSHKLDSVSSHLAPDEQKRLLELRTQWNWFQAKFDSAGVETPISKHEPSEQKGGTAYDALRDIEQEIAELMRRQRIRSGNRVVNEATVHADDTKQLLVSIKSQIQACEALAVYYLADKRCHVLLLSQNGLEVVANLADASTISTLLETWRFHIQNVAPIQPDPMPQLAQLYLARLYDSLIRPISAELAHVDTLNVILPTAWHDLPIAALYDGNRYLVEQFTLTHLSAPRAIIQKRSHEKPHEATALVIGYSDEGRLPKTLQESFTIRDVLPQDWTIEHLTEDNATEQCFKQYCQQATLIHLATHATFRPDNPLFSWLRFADKHVTVTELYDMKMEGKPLVVLSACETGQGKPRGGGVLGMGRGLLAAGASQVVLSRWQLEDAASAELMQHFYQSLNPSQDNVAEALRNAQIATLANHPHPFFWASYMYTPG